MSLSSSDIYSEISNQIKNNSENFNKDYHNLLSDYINKQNKTSEIHKTPDGDGKIITPDPVCVFKTFDLKGEKIFVNILSHKEVSAPKEENILEMNNEFGIRVPMSLSEKVEDFDNSGGICTVYDVIFNTKVTDQAMKDPELMRFILTLICERVNQRFNHKLDINQFKYMKKFKYKGKSVRSQMIKIVSKKVEEVINRPNQELLQIDSGISNSSIAPQIIKEQIPDWSIFSSIVEYEFDMETLNEEEKLIKIMNTSIKNIYNKKIYENNFSYLKINQIGLANEIVKIDNNYDLSDYIKIHSYNSYSCNYFLCKWRFLIIKVSFPLLSKSFALKINIKNNILHIKAKKLYNLKLNLYWMNETLIEKAYFLVKTRELFIFINPPIENQNLKSDNNQYNQNIAEGIKLEDIDNTYLYDLVI